ncbi:helix-turn-helix domain-containing protein [Bacteroides caccae]|jgi:transcriptional regulator with XRE-family HTH domain|uniref:helix-turn-helix domain-containing protein n=1 Tax=Bacteroides caccae TaxID=47678 RepID=UPI001F1ADE3F|nr:helix-turn-helix transcriptional regulator [Bacteroides caccae]MCE8774349.1 helix-turn-helix transcriptional regulator [Bacteroides caccae]
MTRIKEILKEKGLTVNQLADMLEISRQALSKQIQGKMLVETAQRIAEALDVPMWQLFASPEEVQPKKDGLSFTCPHCGKDINIKVA